MATGAPQTIANDLFDRITQLAKKRALSGESPSEFELARLERDADDLRSKDAAQGSVARAAIAAFKWQPEEVRRWADNALRNEHSLDILRNIIPVFNYINDIKGSIDCAAKIAEAAPQNPEFVFGAVNIFLLSGELTMAKKLLKNLKTDDDKKENEVQNICERLAFLSETGLSEDQYKREISIAHEVATSNKIEILGFCPHYVSDDGSKTLCVYMMFTGDLEKEIDLEQQLALRYAEFDDWRPSVLSVEFKSERPANVV